MKIAVLLGGHSAERDVSLATGREIARALAARGHDVIAIDAADGRLLPTSANPSEPGALIGRAPPSDLPASVASGALTRSLEELSDVRGTEAVFIALHGGAGEDGHLQALLDLIDIAYTGSGPLGSALAMDKLVSKELFRGGGVPTPPWLVAPVEVAAIEAELGGFPVVVKPSGEGSTVGVSVAHSAGELEDAVREASRYHGPVLIERFIRGRELAVGVLGDEALPVVEIRPQHEIYDYECKYTKGMSQYEVPAPLSPACTARVQELALRAHRLLRLFAYSRVDFRLDEDEQPWCLEANSLPGMTATSLLPKAAAAAGIPFEELCDRIVRLALQRRAGIGTHPGGGG